MLTIYEFFVILILVLFLVIIAYGIYILFVPLIGITKSNKREALDFFKRVYGGIFTAIFIFFFLQLKEIISSLDKTNLSLWNFIILLIGNIGLYLLLFLFLILIALIVYLILFKE